MSSEFDFFLNLFYSDQMKILLIIILACFMNGISGSELHLGSAPTVGLSSIESSLEVNAKYYVIDGYHSQNRDINFSFGGLGISRGKRNSLFIYSPVNLKYNHIGISLDFNLNNNAGFSLNYSF